MTSAAIDWLTPAARMPWPVEAPFRMRPNLEKLEPIKPDIFLRDDLAEAYRREKSNGFTEHSQRIEVGRLGFETPNVLIKIAEQYCDRFGTHPGLESPRNVALELQEDFVILKQEAETLRTEYLSVCFPSRWDPREKLGLDFSAIHAPVADNQLLQAAGPNLMTLAFMKQPMLRHVWLISPSASLDQHPDKNEAWWAEALADPSPLLARLYFRVERQTTWPLPQFQRAVFFIRVMMCQLLDVLSVGAGRAAALATTLRSMTPAVVAYRGMTDALPRLLAELDATP